MRLHCQFIANKFQWIHIIFHIRKGASNIFRLQYYPLAGIILNREQRTIAHSIAAATGYNWSFAHKHHSVDRHLRTVIPHLVTVRKEGDPAVSQAIAMGRKAYQMILDAMDALTAEDEIAARRVIAADDAVDYDFNAIKHTLAQEIAADPAKVDAALDLLMVIKYLERIGDHAVNVAEWVQFVRTGRYKDESMF